MPIPSSVPIAKSCQECSFSVMIASVLTVQYDICMEKQEVCGMEIRTLRYFLAIVQEGSITKAAEMLHITQPTLSRQMMAVAMSC